MSRVVRYVELCMYLIEYLYMQILPVGFSKHSQIPQVLIIITTPFPCIMAFLQLCLCIPTVAAIAERG